MSTKISIIYAVIAITTFKFFVLSSALTTIPFYDEEVATHSVSDGDKVVDVQADIFHADLNAFHNQLQVPVNETLEVEEMFIWFVSQLKSFIHEEGFEVYKFESVRLKLAQDLADISSLAKDFIFDNTVIMKQFKFAREMFEGMAFSAQELKEYEHVKNTPEFLLKNIMGLNVKLFDFYDFYGNPDLKRPNFVPKLYELWRKLCCWEEEFYTLKHVSDYDRRRFEDTLNSAAEIIHFLLEIATYDPKNSFDLKEVA